MPRKYEECPECHGKGVIKSKPKRQTRADRAAAIATRLAGLQMEVEELQSEVQSHLDNLPEAWQSSGKGDTLQTASDDLDQIVSAVSDASETLSSISFT